VINKNWRFYKMKKFESIESATNTIKMNGVNKMENRLYIANLGKYNEGELVGNWITLPYEEEELQKLLVEIKLGQFDENGEYVHGYSENGSIYEEHAIHDYELPFNIGEYENLTKINNMVQWINNHNIEIVDFRNFDYFYETALCNIKNFASELENSFGSSNAMEIVQDYYTMDDIEELFLKNEAEKGFARLYHFMGNLTPNDEIAQINGYGNLSMVYADDLEGLQKELFEILKTEVEGE
jgi:hypothetical protein